MTTEARAEKVRQERRMKPGALSLDGNMKLGVNEAMLDRQTYSYRWVNDAGNRMKHMHDRDWDPAPEMAAEVSDSLGTTQSRIVDTVDGKPLQAVLMRKRRDWHEGDQKAKQKPLDEQEDLIRKGLIHSKEAPELRGASYTPGTNSISHGR